jgi:hypothetical protein
VKTLLAITVAAVLACACVAVYAVASGVRVYQGQRADVDAVRGAR